MDSERNSAPAAQEGVTAAGISRRSFVVRGAWAALATVGVGILSACTSAAPSSPTSAPAPTTAPKPTTAPAAAPSTAPAAASSPSAAAAASPAAAAPSVAPAVTASKPAAAGQVKLPTYTPSTAIKPDVPGTDVIPDGYVTFPKTPFQSVKSPPGDGSEVTVAGETFNALIPVDQNTLWQNLNKQMNVKLNLNLAAFSDWAFGKFQALVAGGDLPDITMIPIGGVIPNLPDFLEAKIQDLTPFVSGDAIKDYPNLAALPTIGWKGMVYNNKIFAVPIAQSVFYWGLWGHQNFLQDMGLDWPKSAQDFRAAMKKFTNPNAAKYGIGAEAGNRYALDLTNVGGQLWPPIYQAPNNWGVSSDGKWTKDWETDQFKQAVQLARDTWADGSFDPQSTTTYTTPSAGTAFEAGKLLFRFENALNVNDFDAGITADHTVTPTQNPPWVNLLAPPIPAEAGGKGQYNYGIGNFGLIILKKASPDRIKLLLKVIDYVVAPFGSQEYLNANYGVQGQDFNFDANGNPIRTKQGIANVISWNGIMGLPAPVLFDPLNKDFAPTMNKSLQALAAVGAPDPTVGLYSATNQKQGFSIQQNMADGLLDIVVGRRPISDMDSLVSAWRSGGGDQIRQEYQQAYAASQ